MTTSDKTRDKLVSSMRKTKVATNKNTEPEDPVLKVRATAGKKQSYKPKEAVSKTAIEASSQGCADPFQSSRRVWPD